MYEMFTYARAIGSLALGILVLGMPAFVRAHDGPPMCLVEAQTPLLTRDAFWAAEAPDITLFCGSIPDAPAGDPAQVAAESVGLARQRAELFASRGEAALADLQVDLLEASYPRVADRAALLRGRIALQAGDPRAARRAYLDAEQSPDSTVRVEAEVGAVLSLIEADDRRAPAALQRLLADYPELPREASLWFARAQSMERAGSRGAAIRLYRSIDVNHPGTAAGSAARLRLDALGAEGASVREMTSVQRVSRAERLLSNGPMGDARAEVGALLGQSRLSPSLDARVHLMAATLARFEGRWEDAEAHLASARSGGLNTDDPDIARALRRQNDMSEAANAHDEATARRRIRQVARGRRWNRIGPVQLERIVEVGAAAGLSIEVDRALGAYAGRSLSQRALFDAATRAAGVGSEEKIEKLLHEVIAQPGRLDVAARYHLARSLERRGDADAARAAFAEVVERDQSATQYYGLWASLRLRALDRSPESTCGLGLACPAEADVTPRMPTRPAPDLDFLAERLAPIAAAHAESYPWLGRATDLLRLGDEEAATAELYEAYLSWRQAKGRTIRRAGLESVAKGDDRHLPAPDWTLRQARLGLDLSQRELLAEVALSLGDHGTAIGFVGLEAIGPRPRAYAEQVETAARRHGVDPNLLFAVMRVESVYQRRIVSYAGAVGLMQIMPRTGKRIAGALGSEGFTPADLLDPSTNVDYAAWYLASLIQRFDGQLPLAIAAYNGGPHNVRRWLAGSHPDMPLDAFLEQIPFTQTHRYVRRVLTHYAAYRDQQERPMGALPLSLPASGVDPLGF